MTTKKEIEAALAEVVTEWNLAEKAVKLAEQVCGEIVNPAIYELRYAGRRLIEAIALPDTDELKLRKIQDAHFDCCRARHDAIDAATSKISADMDIAVTRLGAANVLKHFPNITDLLEALGEMRDKIANSREKRDDRDAIYATLQDENMSHVVEIFRKFKASEELLKESAKADRRKTLKNNFFGYGGLILATIGIVLTVISMPW